MTPSELKEKLEAFSKIEVELIIKNNRSTFFNVLEIQKNRMRLSLHQLFLDASENICRSLMVYALRGDKRALSSIRCFAMSYFAKADYSHKLLTKKIVVKGKCYDLKEVYENINQKYFQNSLDLSITWFKRPSYRRFNHMTFGSYDRSLKLIRVNGILDNSITPFYFIYFLVYHEMLHAVCPEEVDISKRRRIHTKLFREKEKNFPYYKQAKLWEKDFLMKSKRKQYGWT